MIEKEYLRINFMEGNDSNETFREEWDLFFHPEDFKDILLHKVLQGFLGMIDQGNSSK